MTSIRVSRQLYFGVPANGRVVSCVAIPMRDFPSLKRGVQEFQKGEGMIDSQCTWDDCVALPR